MFTNFFLVPISPKGKEKESKEEAKSSDKLWLWVTGTWRKWNLLASKDMQKGLIKLLSVWRLRRTEEELVFLIPCVWFAAFPKSYFDVAGIYQWVWCDKSEQRLDNVKWTHPVLAHQYYIKVRISIEPNNTKWNLIRGPGNGSHGRAFTFDNRDSRLKSHHL